MSTLPISIYVHIRNFSFSVKKSDFHPVKFYDIKNTMTSKFRLSHKTCDGCHTHAHIVGGKASLRNKNRREILRQKISCTHVWLHQIFLHFLCVHAGIGTSLNGATAYSIGILSFHKES
jgi:hypothetical protein